ncbi:MAG: hypothetical protein ACLS6G_04045 [Christensenellales bacterium]
MSSGSIRCAATRRISLRGLRNGPTLVIHKIVLEPCGGQSCTERTFTLRITGPSYPNERRSPSARGAAPSSTSRWSSAGLSRAAIPSRS